MVAESESVAGGPKCTRSPAEPGLISSPATRWEPPKDYRLLTRKAVYLNVMTKKDNPVKTRQKWVDHKFNLGIDNGWISNILCRVRDAEIRLSRYTWGLTDQQLSHREGAAWSIKEHIGHLTDLEPLWINRFRQFEKGLDELVAADMSNQKTQKADHNTQKIGKLLNDFKRERNELLAVFNGLSDKALKHRAMHPRIKTIMRPVDLLFFIAEHDDHHLATMKSIINKLES